MFIRIKGVILNTDKIEVVQKGGDASYINIPYTVTCNEKVIFRAKTKEERDEFFDSLWQEIEKINGKEGKENDYSSEK